MQSLVAPAQHTVSTGSSTHFNFFFSLNLIRGKDSGMNIWPRSCLTLYLAVLMSAKLFLIYTGLGGSVDGFYCKPRNG